MGNSVVIVGFFFVFLQDIFYCKFLLHNYVLSIPLDVAKML